MTKVNQERREILKTGSPQIASSSVEKSMKDVVELFNRRYRDGENNFIVRNAIEELGINFREDSKNTGVYLESDGSVSLLTVRPSNSKEATQDLIKLLGIYLFTDVLANNGFYDENIVLHISDEKIINEFLLLMILPVQSLEQFTPMSQLVEWSIDYKIPLPVIRNAVY